MTTTLLSIDAIPGPEFRGILRHGLTSSTPWSLLIDARSTPPPSLDRLAMTLRLTSRVAASTETQRTPARSDSRPTSSPADRWRGTTAGPTHQPCR
jgi:hypothetical protein